MDDAKRSLFILLILIVAGGGLVLAAVQLLPWLIPCRPYDLEGPNSPTGLTVVAHVSDCGGGWSADFYTDIEVLNEAGERVAIWSDSGGQYPRGGPETPVKSMQWTEEGLQFKTRRGIVTLPVPGVCPGSRQSQCNELDSSCVTAQCQAHGVYLGRLGIGAIATVR